MNKRKTIRRVAIGLTLVVTVPVVLFLVLAVLIYLPPVQRFAVDRTTAILSETTGMHIRIGHIRLAFPLDLTLGDMQAVAGRDTLLDARALRVGVKLWPLVYGRAEVDGIYVFDASLNTLDLIPDTHLKGRVGVLTAALPGGVDLPGERVDVDRVLLKNTTMAVELSDTAQKDTTPSASRWDIRVRRADVLNTTVFLRMPGDSLRIGARLGRVALRGGRFDTGRSYYAVRRFALDRSSATYDVPQAVRLRQGLDPNHIAVDRLSLHVDSLNYDSAGRLSVDLRQLAFREKSGLAVDRTAGRVSLDTLGLTLPSLTLSTPHSRLTAEAALDWNAFATGRGGRLHARLEAHIGRADVLALTGDLLPADVRSIMPATAASLNLQADGNVSRLTLDRLEADVAGVVRLTAKGNAADLLTGRRSGHFDWTLRTGYPAPLGRLLPSSLAFPRGLSARGDLRFQGDDYRANLRVSASGGRLDVGARAGLSSERYAAQVTARDFPLGAFLPDLPLGDFSGSLKASGQGFDPMTRRAAVAAKLAIDSLRYDRYPLGGLRAELDYRRQKGRLTFETDNPLLQGNGTLEATVAKQRIDATLTADFPLIGLHHFMTMEDTLDLGAALTLNAATRPGLEALALDGSLSNIRFLMPRQSVTMKDIAFAFGTSPDTTHAQVKSGDFDLSLRGHAGLGRISERVGRFTTLLTQQLDERRLDQEALKQQLPRLSFHVSAGRENPVSRFIAMKGIDIDSVNLNVNADPLVGLNGTSKLFTLRTGGLQLDDVSFRIAQDSNGVKMNTLVVNSAPDNPHHFEVHSDAYVLPAGAGVEVKYIDSDQRTGVDLGLRAELVDSGMYVHLYPEHPVIAYRDFTVNRRNYVYLNNHQQLFADVALLADDGTGLQIYGQPRDSVNDLTVSVKRLNLGELSNVLPYLPRIEGLLSGDVHLLQSPNDLSAMTMLEVDGMAFEGTPLGRIGLNATYMPDTVHHLFDASVLRNDDEILQCSGVYADKGDGYFAGRAQLVRFPLGMLNGFMAGSDMAFTGDCNGAVTLRGPVDTLRIDGEVVFDSAHVYSDVYGFDFRMADTPIRIADNRLTFDDYALYSTGSEPLRLGGAVDFSDFGNVTLALDMRARNYELINTKRKRESLLFGKVFVDFDGSLRGNMEHLFIRGNVSLLGNTDMTYVLKDSPLTVEDQLEGLVQFVNFNDSLAPPPAEPTVMGLDLTLGIDISEAAHFRCDLSDDKESYVELEGGGNLNFRLTQQGDMRLTGRFTTNSGEMKYALPVIPLKTFQLVAGSYVDFTGDVMNPTLNITAKERVKATVTENDVPRSVNFDVGVAITKPLEQMGLEFIIEAPEDLSIQNQLAAMSAEQRGRVAVTMLATGMYITDEGGMGGTSGFKANDALNAFLQSEIQNIAGSALRTIDVSLGVENATSATGAEQTDYSFQFAKRFWGNRISVIVGGKVSTGADAENSAESFIDNVSIEYRLDKSSTRHVKVFYNRNTNDPLEGLLTKTGAGLVLRRKTNRLGELFIFRTRKPQTTQTPVPTK